MHLTQRRQVKIERFTAKKRQTETEKTKKAFPGVSSNAPGLTGAMAL
jgi:hypothetical protein